jgi:hypothetical protein
VRASRQGADPGQLPQVAWRAGIDLEPIDLNDDVAVSWLEALVWPEEQDRLERLRAAIEIARREQPLVVQGDLLDMLPQLANQAPADATLVVFHTAVLAYLSEAQRWHFSDQMRQVRAEWVTSEGPGVVPDLRPPRTAPVARSHFVIATNSHPVAFCDPHGRWLQWL